MIKVDGVDDKDAHKLIAIPDVNGNTKLYKDLLQRRTREKEITGTREANNIIGQGQGVQGQGMAIEVDASGSEVSRIYVNYWFESFYRGTPFHTLHGELKL